jgi:hypothetical protein
MLPKMHFAKKWTMLCLAACGVFCVAAQGNMNMQQHDMAPYYFGISFGYNSSTMLTTRNEAFLQQNDIERIEPHSSRGLELGFLGTARFSNRFALRFAPKLILGGSKYLTYYFTPKYLEDNPTKSAIENIRLPANLLSFPFDLKMNSDRIHNFRVYLFGGLRYDINLSSNSSEYEAIKQLDQNPPPLFRKNDFSVEGGIGFNIYLPFSVISPEIKISKSIGNSQIRDPQNPYSAVLDQIKTQTIVFTINVEQ